MPQRQNVVEVPTVEVQGDGSWIKVRRPTVEEVKANQKRQDARENARLRGEVSESDVEGEYDRTCKQALSYVVSWNWVDDDGNNLPPPTTEGVHDLLTDREIEVILIALFGDKGRRKN